MPRSLLSFEPKDAPFASPPSSNIGSTIRVTVELTEVVDPLTTKLPVTVKLAPEISPVTLKLVNVPTLVILGCEFVYTVPAINAFDTCPLTLAPATELAMFA